MSTAVKKLESDLRALIEPERVHFVELAYDHLKRGIDRFLESRKPNKTIRDVFGNLGYDPPGLREATNYVEAEREMYRARGVTRTYGQKYPEAPPWEVEYKPGWEAILRRLAETIAEDQIRIFLARALEKLGPVVERKPGYTVKQPENRTMVGRFSGGTWVGYLEFSWSDGVKFVAKMKIITNYSVNGNAYAQYPMTFQECALDPQAQGRAGVASIEQIWESVGYVPPKKPEGPPRKRWTRLIGGSVVEVDGKPVLLHTAGACKKLGIPADPPQIGRIDVGHAGACLERVDGTTANMKFTQEEKDAFDRVEGDYDLPNSHGVAAKMRRDRAFAEFYGKPASGPDDRT